MCPLGMTVSTLQKKQKNCGEHEQDEAGDLWDHTAVAADSKLVVALVVGKRTKAQTLVLVHDTKNRLRRGHLPAILTDAYEGYESALLEVFGRRYPVRGQIPLSRAPTLSHAPLAPRAGLWPSEKSLPREAGGTY
jgi:IS1 family transposase